MTWMQLFYNEFFISELKFSFCGAEMFNCEETNLNKSMTYYIKVIFFFFFNVKVNVA